MKTLSKNEIERNPQPPQFNGVTINLLTDLCFRKDDNVEPVDLIFVFSSSHGTKELSSLIKNLLQKKVSQKVFITGGIPTYIDTPHSSIPEAELVLRGINKEQYPQVDFYSESISRNTLENVTEALKVLDFSQYSKILFIFKSHAAGRGYLTLKKFMSPATHIFQKTWAPLYEEQYNLKKNNWFDTDFGRRRVWGEYLRIRKYGERGDIAYPDKARGIVRQIEELTL